MEAGEITCTFIILSYFPGEIKQQHTRKIESGSISAISFLSPFCNVCSTYLMLPRFHKERFKNRESKIPSFKMRSQQERLKVWRAPLHQNRSEKKFRHRESSCEFRIAGLQELCLRCCVLGPSAPWRRKNPTENKHSISPGTSARLSICGLDISIFLLRLENFKILRRNC